MFAALACLLAFAPPGRRIAAGLFALTAAFAVAQMPLPRGSIEIVFIGCWASLVATAVTVHFGRRLTGYRPVMLAVNAGAWAGATVAVAGTTLDLAVASPWLALAVPGAWLAAPGRGVAVKVVSSWLIAIALLAAVLPLVPTPGYAPDHLD